MKNKIFAVTSFLEIVPLAGVKRSMRRLVRSYFSKQETAGPGHASVQSVAGMLACKAALVKMILAVAGVRISRKEIVLSHLRNGAPRLAGIARKKRAYVPDIKSIRISVSHTKTHAYGLAVLQQKGKRNVA
jgi:phosphopantetheinyl transferase (holo-ACP synthase)